MVESSDMSPLEILLHYTQGILLRSSVQYDGGVVVGIVGVVIIRWPLTVLVRGPCIQEENEWSGARPELSSLQSLL